MTKIGGEPQTKDGKKHKEYSIESVKKTRIVTYMYDGKIQELPIEYLEKMYITNYKGEKKTEKFSNGYLLLALLRESLFELPDC